ncbi:MAG: AsmA family protein [Saprospirales bacterium]|nr:AsmA family protein [Saprospirales bacterium]
MKVSKVIKRSFLAIFILLVLFIASLVAIPYLFKDELLLTIRQEVNANLNAEVDFSDASLSLFQSFPNLTISLSDLKVSGVDSFEGVDLLDAEAFEVTVDIMSVIKNLPIQIQSIGLQKPKVHVMVLKGGAANYDITKPSETVAAETDTSSTSFTIKLKRFTITDGEVIYDDRDGDMYAEILGLNHESKGELTLDVYDLATQTTMESLTYEMGGISYLTKAKIDLDAGFLIDMAQSKYTLKENNLLINALQLKADGFVAMPDGDNIDMDLSFQAPGGDFREFFSLIPNAYIEGYENVDIKGKCERPLQRGPIPRHQDQRHGERRCGEIPRPPAGYQSDLCRP